MSEPAFARLDALVRGAVTGVESFQRLRMKNSTDADRLKQMLGF